ncbi:hypothetical protein ACFWYW_29420 [Nonomuraea sp. NPDC059023]
MTIAGYTPRRHGEPARGRRSARHGVPDAIAQDPVDLSRWA